MQCVDSLEFSQWCAFLNTEENAEDWRLARLLAHISQIAGDKNVRARDFMPKRHKGNQTGEDIKALFQAFANGHNERLKRRRERAPNG